MKNNCCFPTILLALLCTLPLTVSCGNDADPQTSDTEAVTTTGETESADVSYPQMKDPSAYAAPKREAEVYDPADARALKILGVSKSDGEYAVVYGECPIGTTVHIQNDFGEFSVLSEGGCFAMRIHNPDSIASLTATLSYNDEAIAEEVKWRGLVTESNTDEEWAVFIGGENQGFYYKMVPDFIGGNLYTDSLLNLSKSRWKSRVENLKEVGDGCEVICLLAPSAMTMFPDLVPEEAISSAIDTYFPQYRDLSFPPETTRFDQISQALTEAGVTVIDLRETYDKHRDDALSIYYDYDTHWTEYGAYLAYVELYRHISKRFPAAIPHSFDEFSWDFNYYKGGDISGYFNLNDDSDIFEYGFRRNMLFDTVPEVENLVRYTIDDENGYMSYGEEVLDGDEYDTNRTELPDIYVIRNSYGATIYDLMLERSNRAYFRSTFSYSYNKAEIMEKEPDYLIYIFSEWDLAELFNN
ncbi:MAG: hypothetical protein IJC98_06370 [Clostridia bacterium]|nr:hypothetical protein [Clostridia bacterium]